MMWKHAIPPEADEEPRLEIFLVPKQQSPKDLRATLSKTFQPASRAANELIDKLVEAHGQYWRCQNTERQLLDREIERVRNMNLNVDLEEGLITAMAVWRMHKYHEEALNQVAERSQYSLERIGTLVAELRSLQTEGPPLLTRRIM